MPERSANLAGIGLMLLAMLLFSANDTLGKWLVASYTVAQILLIRSISASLMLAPFVMKAGWEPFRRMQRPWLQLARVALATAETACFYFSVWYIPLADAMVFYLAGPIYVTALSALILREKVGPFRWAAVLVGFVGVVIVLRPTADGLAGFGPGQLIALTGSACYALLMIVTRQVKETPNVVMSATQIAATALLGLLLAPLGWPSIAGFDFLLLLVLGVAAVLAILFVNQSLRIAPASVVAPFQYSTIVWAVLFGYLVFGDIPRAHMILGATIIIASGLFIFVREQRVKIPVVEQPTPAQH